MNIGIPKEMRTGEYRVGLSPAGVQSLTGRGHSCFVENGAGEGAGFSNYDYEKAGAQIVYSAHEAFGRADLILKISRPLKEELELIRPGSTLAGILHLPSANQEKIDYLLSNKITTIAYEQIERPDGIRPVLRQMSLIGGQLAAQVAAHLLQNNTGGKGILLGGMPGVPPAEVVIIGAGVFGRSAAKAFLGLGAQVTILDKEAEILYGIYENYPMIVTMKATKANIQRTCAYADVVIAAAASPAQTAPVIIPRDVVQSMKPRSIIMDISIDQGGCVETSRPTTHDQPTYVEEGVIHYCVPNMPSVLARTATHAFVNAALPYIQEIAQNGVVQTINENQDIANSINTHDGKLVRLSRITNK